MDRGRCYVRSLGDHAKWPGVSTFWSWGGSAAAWMNGRKSSIGIGKIVVEVCSAAISVAVCR
jgi:hypothetical protein